MLYRRVVSCSGLQILCFLLSTHFSLFFLKIFLFLFLFFTPENHKKIRIFIPWRNGDFLTFISNEDFLVVVSNTAPSLEYIALKSCDDVRCEKSLNIIQYHFDGSFHLKRTVSNTDSTKRWVTLTIRKGLIRVFTENINTIYKRVIEN